MSRPVPLRLARAAALPVLASALATACTSSSDNQQQPPQDEPPATVTPGLAENYDAACEQAEIMERSEQRVKVVRDRHGSDILDHPNVHGVGVSRCDANSVISILADEDMPSGERITEIEDISVIWIRGGPFTAGTE